MTIMAVVYVVRNNIPVLVDVQLGPSVISVYAGVTINMRHMRQKMEHVILIKNPVV